MKQWEYKFVFKHDEMASDFFNVLSNIQNFAGYRCEKEKCIKNIDYYFDSQDLNLEFLGIVCRARHTKGSSKYNFIVKRQSVGPNNEIVYPQSEPVKLKKNSFDNMLQGGFPGNVKSLLAIFALNSNIEQILRLEVKRRVINIFEDSQKTASINLDYVQAFLPGRNTVLAEDFEVELKSDQPQFLQADLFKDFLRNSFHLIPVSRSKLRRMAPIIQQNRIQHPQKVILDMDTGVDDALAIILAMKSPELEVLGITTSGGNVDVEQSALNTAVVLNNLKDSVKDRYEDLPPVAKGEALAKGTVDASDVHGPDGLGGICDRCSLEAIKDTIQEDAARLFKDIVHKNEAKTVTLITTGPLTNVALWIEKHPDAVEKIKQIICMGGVFFQEGNRSQTAEFNIHSNPSSARKLVEFCRQPASSGIRQWQENIPLIFIGLDVTHKVKLRRTILEEAIEARPDDKNIKFIKNVTGTYMDFYYRNEGLDGCYLHDPLAVGYAIDPSFCQSEQFILEVEDQGRVTSGMTVADYRPTRLFKDKMKEVTWICYKVDAKRFENLFLKRALNIENVLLER